MYVICPFCIIFELTFATVDLRALMDHPKSTYQFFTWEGFEALTSTHSSKP